MSAPHVWLKEAIETAVDGLTVWPVECTGRIDPPYVVYSRQSTTRQQLLADTLDPDPEDDMTPPVAKFTIVIFATGYEHGWEIARAIAAAIHRFSGSASGWTIESCFVTDERDGPAGFLEGSEQPTYTVEQTVEIAWS